MRLPTTPKRIRLSQIHIPQNRNLWRPPSRCSPEALAELIDEIESVGWVHAVVVRERSEGGFELLDGERRVEAEREQGSTEIDAVIVQADDETAAVITLLAQLPKAELSPIHWARLMGVVRYLNIRRGGKGTNEEIAERIGRDPSTVSRHMTVLKGLSPTVLNDAGLRDDDLVDVPGKTLRALAKLSPKERNTALRKIGDSKKQAAGTKALARSAAKVVSTTKRGRPTKPYTCSNRADGRVRFTLSGAALDAQTARDALGDLGPVLVELVTAAEVDSLDDFVGLDRPSLAARTIMRISFLSKKLHDIVAAKMPAISAAYGAAGLGQPGPAVTK